MANATLNKTEKTVVTVTGVTLELTVEESLFLKTVLNSIGGDPHKSARKYANRINDAMELAKVLSPVHSHDIFIEKQDSLWCDDESDNIISEAAASLKGRWTVSTF